MAKKLYIIQKYVWADTPAQALRLERNFQADEVFIDNKWRENQDSHPKSIGYSKN